MKMSMFFKALAICGVVVDAMPGIQKLNLIRKISKWKLKGNLKMEIMKLATPNDEWPGYREWAQTDLSQWKAQYPDGSVIKVRAIVRAIEVRSIAGLTAAKKLTLQQQCASYILQKDRHSTGNGQPRASLDRRSESLGKNSLVQGPLAKDVTDRLIKLIETLKSRANDSFLSGVADNLQKEVLKREMMNLTKRETTQSISGAFYSVSIVKAILAAFAQGSAASWRDLRNVLIEECAHYIHTKERKPFELPDTRQKRLTRMYSSLSDNTNQVRHFKEYDQVRGRAVGEADSTKGFILRVAEKLIQEEENYASGGWSQDLLPKAIPKAILRDLLARRAGQDRAAVDHGVDSSGDMGPAARAVVRAGANALLMNELMG